MSRGQEKVVVPRGSLPAVSKLSNGSYGYILRYRILSEDQNRFSHWSPVRELEIPPPLQVSGNLSVIGNTALLVWGDEESRPRYDVFISFDGNEYFYHGTTPTHQYTFLIDEGASTVQAAVQVESINKERDAQIEIFESTLISLL